MKVNKVNKIKNNNKNKNKTEKKFKFGRNLGTLLIIIGGALVLFLLVFTPYSYITTAKNNDVTSYISGSPNISVSGEDNVTRMKGSDFDLFDIDFYCTNWNIDEDQAKFHLGIKWNDNTSKLNNKETLLQLDSSNSNNYTVRTGICLAADWVGYCEYSTTKEFAVTNSKTVQTYSSYRISGIEQFPSKANTWPFKVNVETPNAYVYIYFGYYDTTNPNNLKKVWKTYILEYTYDEYHTSKTQGGIIAK